MKKFEDKIAQLTFNSKGVEAFGTYSGQVRVTDRAVKRMEKIVKKLTNTRLLQLSLSLRVKGVTDPIADGKLS